MTSPDEAAGMIEVSTGDQLFFTYRGAGGRRPAVLALYSPEGIRLSRDIDQVPEGSDDHPHHKGIWWGAVVGDADIWTERETSGSIIPTEPPRLHRLDDDSLRLEQAQQWVGPDGTVLLDDQRELHAYATGPDGTRILDIVSRLRAVSEPATLVDTKEAGLVAVRVLPSMEGRRGGLITLSTGASGEAGSWGRAADWCDYSGPTTPGGGPDTWAGITVFDHPANPRPAYWHVRDYGLLTANPFGLATFTGDPGMDGSMTLTPGSETVFRYRILTHPGDHSRVDLAAHHRAYAAS